jgi:serine/threonine protein kinase
MADTTMCASWRLLPGARLGPYEIQSALGAGGMGEVYRARDPRLGRDVAIKVMPQTVAADPSRLRRFEQEARAIAALSHPNVLTTWPEFLRGCLRYRQSLDEQLSDAPRSAAPYPR